MSTSLTEPTDTAPLEPFCLFRCASTPLAIRLESVVEVLEVDAMVRLPRTPPVILGICILRREVIPIVTFQAIDKHRPQWASTSALVLMLRGDRGAWALKIDATGTTVATDRVEPEPLEHMAGTCLVQRGWLSREETRHAVIDYDSTWRHLRQDVEAAYSRTWGRESRSVEATRRRSSPVMDNGLSNGVIA